MLTAPVPVALPFEAVDELRTPPRRLVTGWPAPWLWDPSPVRPIVQTRSTDRDASSCATGPFDLESAIIDAGYRKTWVPSYLCVGPTPRCR